MAFIGNTSTTQAFTPAVDYFSGNGSTTAFTLSRPVASVAQVEAVIDNVVQNPSSAYTVSANTITFSSAPLSGTNNIYVRYTSPITQVNALTQAPSVLGPMSVGINGAIGIGGTTNPIVNMSGNANNYVQAYVNNQSTGTGASADLVVYPDNGTDASGWVDMGITSSTFSNPTYGITGANEGYLFMSAPSGASKTGNLVIATDSTGTQNAIKFATAGFGSTTERMRIDSSGNVGIGTASPSAKLNVKSTYVSDTTAQQRFEDNTGTALSFGGTGGGVKWLNVADVAVPATGYPLAFQTGGTERMRINSSGNLLVGGTTDQTTRILAYATGGTDFFAGFNGATKNFAVASSGQIYSQFTSIASLSDRRTKTQISAISYGLNEVNELNPVTFFFNGDTSNKLYGFIAQDVQSILPELVSESSNKAEDGTSYLTLKMGDMLPVLVKAIQELKAINDTQAETINALTARIEALENR